MPRFPGGLIDTAHTFQVEVLDPVSELLNQARNSHTLSLVRPLVYLMQWRLYKNFDLVPYANLFGGPGIEAGTFYIPVNALPLKPTSALSIWQFMMHSG